jgi:hypothetical protein
MMRLALTPERNDLSNVIIELCESVCPGVERKSLPHQPLPRAAPPDYLHTPYQAGAVSGLSVDFIFFPVDPEPLRRLLTGFNGIDGEKDEIDRETRYRAGLIGCV